MKNIARLLCSFTVLCTLSACAPGALSSRPGSSPAPISPSVPVSSNPPSSTTDSVEKPVEPEVTSFSYQEFLAVNEMPTLPSIGSPKILVVPVRFKNDTAVTPDDATAKVELQTLFFGPGVAGGPESVASFYTKSSYGHLNMSGVVTDTYTTAKTLTQYIDDIKRTGSYDITGTITGIVSGVTGFLSQTYPVSDYDLNGDDRYDAIWMVYLHDYFSTTKPDNLWTSNEKAQNEFLWAYTICSTGFEPAGAFAWASYSFTKEESYSVPDPHTFIHETGHLLGLDDYYDYDGYASPAGMLDMMDYNILDHNPYSKYLLGWTSPTAIEAAGTYVLKPFQEDGQFYLIGTDWNGSWYDQYLLIEYYTPDGLNALDSSKEYVNGLSGFTEPGLKIYLVDSRVGQITYRRNGFNEEYVWNNKYLNSVDESDFTDVSYVDLIYSNTPSYSYDDFAARNGNHPLIRLLEATGSERFMTSTAASADNSTLFQTGDSFGKDRAYSFYGGASIPFSLTVESLADDGARLTVQAL